MNDLLYRMSIVHRKLDKEIKHEATRRLPDFLRLARLKKLRLALKDRIARLVKFPLLNSPV
ncbi:MAG: YdcH family protein [Rhodospirillaceae bacterium]|nr:YdcH family protein [Rhodospirillaceae bacterium]